MYATVDRRFIRQKCRGLTPNGVENLRRIELNLFPRREGAPNVVSMARATNEDRRWESSSVFRVVEEGTSSAGPPAEAPEPPEVTRARHDEQSRDSLRRVVKELRTRAKVERLLRAAGGTETARVAQGGHISDSSD